MPPMALEARVNGRLLKRRAVATAVLSDGDDVMVTIASAAAGGGGGGGAQGGGAAAGGGAVAAQAAPVVSSVAKGGPAFEPAAPPQSAAAAAPPSASSGGDPGAAGCGGGMSICIRVCRHIRIRIRRRRCRRRRRWRRRPRRRCRPQALGGVGRRSGRRSTASNRGEWRRFPAPASAAARARWPARVPGRRVAVSAVVRPGTSAALANAYLYLRGRRRLRRPAVVAGRGCVLCRRHGWSLRETCVARGRSGLRCS